MTLPRTRIRLLARLLACACAAALVAPVSAQAVGVRLVAEVRGLSAPIGVVSANDGSGRLFVIEKGGTVRIVSGRSIAATPFIDLRGSVSGAAEQGLLGLAFSPGYPATDDVFVNYTDLAGDTVIARYASLLAGDRVDPASKSTVLAIDQPFANHNGGCLVFGPDGYLYAGMGDGGSGGDPLRFARNPASLLGKMLRLDVSSVPYTVPADNPFVGVAGTRPEIWASGLRNPWRFSFDRDTGDLWIGDVGQGLWEEIDYQPASSAGGQDWGWSLYEGTHAYPPGIAPWPTAGLSWPLYEYPHGAGNDSVTGGHVWRAAEAGPFWGRYLFGDFESGRIWTLQRSGSSAAVAQAVDTPLLLTSFGEGEAGELYVAEYGGAVYRLLPDSTPPVVPVTRVAGADRYATAALLAEDAWPAAAGDTVVFASGEAFPDALSASALAGSLDAPLLLTRGAGLPTATSAFLDAPARSTVVTAVIVGGTGAVSEAVADELRLRGLDVTRVAGIDRYDTAARVAGTVRERAAGAWHGRVFIARGDEFADALAAAPLAYAGTQPVLLTRPTALPPVTADALVSIGASEAVVCGGTGAVSGSVVASLGVPATRLGGATRYDTAVLIARHGVATGVVSFARVGVASGQGFPDALAGGSALGATGGVLLLSPQVSLAPATADELWRRAPDIGAVHVLGGAGALSGDTGSLIRWQLP